MSTVCFTIHSNPSPDRPLPAQPTPPRPADRDPQNPPSPSPPLLPADHRRANARRDAAIMCREVVFSGTCSRCAGTFVWTDLAQQLSCLEAKNTGAFGCCRRGVHREDHTFDRECDPCAAETEADEGYGGMESEASAAGQQHQVLGAKKAVADRGGGEDARKKKRQRTS